MPVVSITSYPTVQTITNLARSMTRDDMAGATGTIGEGQIFVDNMSISLTMANFFNSAVRKVCRKLRLTSAPMLIADNYIIPAIPPMNGPQGLAVADPSVQVFISFAGYFDGTEMHSTLALPPGLFQVLRCWERETSSNDVFSDMGEPSNGLAGIYQTNGWGRWEWRQDQVNLPGSLDTRDIRLRYSMILNPIFVATANPATTYLPIMDCEEAVATEIVRLVAIRKTAGIEGITDEAVGDLTNEQVHQQQGQNYCTPAYGSESGPILNRGI